MKIIILNYPVVRSITTILNRQNLLMILILITISTVHSKTKPTLAVLDFEGYGISDFEVQTLTDRLRNYIARIGTYRLVERGAVEEVPKEQGFQQSGCTSDECIVEVGKLLGVQYMLGGSMGRNSEAIPKGSS